MGNINSQIPNGWTINGSHPAVYEVGVDKTVVYNGQVSGYIKSRHDHPIGFATLMQTYKADQQRGQHLQMSAYVKAEDVTNWAGLWMRVDGAAGKILSFDNMQNRPLAGSFNWSRHTIVLDVPASSAYIAFGVLLRGNGKVWVDDFQFEVVGLDVPATHLKDTDHLPQPQNLNFEDHWREFNTQYNIHSSPSPQNLGFEE